jgi:hypothetical protein
MSCCVFLEEKSFNSILLRQFSGVSFHFIYSLTKSFPFWSHFMSTFTSAWFWWRARDGKFLRVFLFLWNFKIRILNFKKTLNLLNIFSYQKTFLKAKN